MIPSKYSSMRKMASLAIVAGLALAACGGDDSSTNEATTVPAATEAPGTDESTPDADPLAALYEECKAEGAKVITVKTGVERDGMYGASGDAHLRTEVSGVCRGPIFRAK